MIEVKASEAHMLLSRLSFGRRLYYRTVPFWFRRNVVTFLRDLPTNLPCAISCYKIAPKGKKFMTFKWAIRR